MNNNIGNTSNMKDGDLYDLDQIKVIWKEVLSCVCEYC